MVNSFKESFVIATHNKSFHADDVIAASILTTIFPDCALVRTRDPAIINGATIVFDVGFEYNSKTYRYDHHQKGGPVRENGIRYSSAGLVWKHFAVPYLETQSDDYFGTASEQEYDEMTNFIIHQMDKNFFQLIDEIDNGQRTPLPLELPCVLDSLNVKHLDAKDHEHDEAFWKAVSITKPFIEGYVRDYRQKYENLKIIEKAYGEAEDKRILVFPTTIDANDVINDRGWETVFTICKRGNDYMLYAVSPPEDRFAKKVPLPAEWGGLSQEDLVRETGLKSLTFLHNGLFCACLTDLTDAIELAKVSIQKFENNPGLRR